MNIVAMSIEGWMSEQELEWLAMQASGHRRIVELGSYLGRSTRALADATPGVVFAVDNWIGPTSIDMDAAKRASLYDCFRENLRELIDDLRVVPINLDHSHIAELGVANVDMIFIDGDHEYDSVVRDIRFALDCLGSSGLLCGHDASWPGVRRAVSELVPGAKLVAGTDIWVRA